MSKRGDDAEIARLGALVGTLEAEVRSLREREAQLRLFVQYAPVPCAMFDRDMRYLLASGCWAEHYRLAPQDLVGRTHYEVFPELGESCKAIHRRCLAGATEKFDAYPFPRADGSVDRVRWECRPWYASDGSVGGVIILSQLVTEEVRTIEALRRRDELLRDVGRLARVGGWELDAATRQGRWTDQVARIHDLDPSVAANKEVTFDFYHGASRDRIQAAVQDAIEKGVPYDLELEIVSARGVHRWVRTIGRPVVEEGRVVRLVGSMQDVTDRREVEEALRRSERSYREIFDAMQDGIVLHDVDGRVLDVNDALREMFGYPSKDDAIESSEVIGPDEPGAFGLSAGRARLPAAMTDGPQTFEWLARKKGGDRFWVEVTLRPAEIDGEKRILAVVRDIAQRKTQQGEIARLNRLYRTLSAVDQATVRCEIREQLLDEVCGAMIREGEFVAARVVEADAGRDSARVTLRLADDSPSAAAFPCEECDVARTVARTGAHLICNDARVDELSAGCRGALQRSGAMACAGFPLRVAGEVRGAFSVCAAERDFFQPEEIRLLDEIALDIGHALETLEARRRHRAVEAALGQSEETFRALFDVAPVGLALADPATRRWIAVNRKMCEITGYAESELLRMGVKDVAVLDDPEDEERALRGLLSGATSGWHAERRYRRKDGAIVWVRVHVSGIRGPGGELVCTVGSVDDITTRRRTDETLRLQGAALEAAASAIAITDADGRIEWANTSFADATGLDQPVGQPLPILESYRGDDAFVGRLWQTVHAGTSWQREVTSTRPDGTTLDQEVTLLPVRAADGAVTNVIAIAQDITGRKRLEAQYRQAQKMEAIGQLAGGVAHDFNNILTSILMQAELGLDEPALSAALREIFTQIRADGDRAAALTRRLLLLSRRQVIQPRALDLNEVVAGLGQMLRRVIGEDIRLDIALGASARAIHADAGMVEQVLLNLVVNARDAMAEGGTLTVTTSEVTVGEGELPSPEARPGPYVCLRVADTGSGIAPGVMPRIFEPFFTTKEAGRGTGLGLATVFGIVRQHRGWVTVDSRSGHGAVFSCYWPVAPQASPQPAGTDGGDAHGGTETVLLVEDDDAVRRATRGMLLRYGYRVLEAASGAEALEVWAKHRGSVALVITDLVMPGGIDGQQLAQRLSAEATPPRIMYISGYNPEVGGRKLVLKPGQKFLLKPFGAEDLLRTVRSVLDE